LNSQEYLGGEYRVQSSEPCNIRYEIPPLNS
jgi:hypothetical protein